MIEARRILILTADAGFGHRSAANAIAAALQETHGPECTVEIVNPWDHERAPLLLRSSQSDYDRFVREMPQVYKLSYQASDAKVPSRIVEGALALLFYDCMREILARYRPDVIVGTYPLYQASLGALFALSKRRIPLFNVVTDLVTVHRLWFHSAADLTLVPTLAVRDLAIQQGIAADRVQVTGIPVHPDLAQERRERSVLRSELGWQPDLTTVLAVGSKRVMHLDEVLRVLNHSGLPLQLAVVAGGDDELYRRLQDCEWHVPTRLYNFVENMPALLHAADCILCKAGGLIVSEALACGLPLILTDVLPGQEVGNAGYVVAGGAGELSQGPLDALEILCHWLARGKKLLVARAANARRLGRPRAAHDIGELAWAAAVARRQHAKG